MSIHYNTFPSLLFTQIDILRMISFGSFSNRFELAYLKQTLSILQPNMKFKISNIRNLDPQEKNIVENPCACTLISNLCMLACKDYFFVTRPFFETEKQTKVNRIFIKY